jgi:hypothetical protein
MQVNSERTTTNDVIQIGDINLVVKDVGKLPIVIGDPVNPFVQKSVMANDHEASSINPLEKYFQPRWCPPGLTRTQKRKLQHLRFQEK